MGPGVAFLEPALVGNIIFQLIDGDTDLLHGVTVPDGDAVVGGRFVITHGLEVYGDTQGCTDLVLPAVTLADGAGIVEVHHEILLQLMVNFLGLGGELLAQGQHGGLEGRQGRMQVQYGADVVLAVLVLTHHLLVVGLAQEGQSHPVAAQTGLDDIGDIMLVLLLIEVFQTLAGGLLMAAQVVIGPVGNAPQFAPAGAEGELILDVRGGTGIEGQLGGLMVPEPQSGTLMTSYLPSSLS